jgi:uncharacterized membrane protein YhaH (DUF805 family)
LIFLSKISTIFGWIYSIYALVVLVPTLSLSVRRLRDAGKHWAWVFITLLPVVGAIWLRDAGKQWAWVFITLLPVVGAIWFIYLMCQPTAGVLPPGLS